MGIKSLHVKGYRSIREIRLGLGRLNVLTGPNGCGKSNLYHSMFLLHAAARGELARTVADEGGMPSLLWAGPIRRSNKKEPVRMRLKVELEDMEFEMRCGITTPVPRSQFNLDPEVKEEFLNPPRKRAGLWGERNGGTAWVLDADGRRGSFPFALDSAESMLAQIREPELYPQLAGIAREFRDWRFYHYFRTDPQAPQRHAQIGVRTPVLDHEGRHLAAALQTIREIGDGAALDAAIESAFPGAKLRITVEDNRFGLQLHMPQMGRPFEARELSDGTLRYLCLLAALLSPRPPALLAFNEPETSLHPDLIVPLARLIAGAAQFSQLWITTHSEALAAAIEKFSGQARIELEKVDGETRIVGQGILD